MHLAAVCSEPVAAVGERRGQARPAVRTARAEADRVGCGAPGDRLDLACVLGPAGRVEDAGGLEGRLGTACHALSVNETLEN